MRRVILLFLCIVAMHSRALSGRYGEHKRIGDEAFYRVMPSLTGEEKQFLMDALLSPSSGNMDKTEPYYFLKLRGEDKESIKVTYGDLTGLSGDHAESPLELIEELNDKYSQLRQITILQHKYMDLYYFDAPDAEVAKRV